jgi:hypothetical protein
MRASSLSNARVIDLLNHHFVPVHADGVYYQTNAVVSPDEKAAYRRIFQDFYQFNKEHQQAGLTQVSVGTVHAYVLDPAGKPFDALHVAEAKPERVIAMLERAVQFFKVPGGDTVAKPMPQSVPPRGKPDSLVLHLTARYLVAKNQPGSRKDMDEDFVPVAPQLGGERSGGWNALPSEDWIELKRPEWVKLLPAAVLSEGSSWEMDKDVAAKLLTRFYPTTENNDLAKNRIDRQALKGIVLSVRNGAVRARIDGTLKMKHTFYPNRPDENFVEATIVGYLDFEMNGPRVLSLRLITERASYGGESRRFGVAVRSLSQQEKH